VQAVAASTMTSNTPMPAHVAATSGSHASGMFPASSTTMSSGRRSVRPATSRWYASLLAAQASVSCESPCLELPCLLLQAGEDRVVDNKFNESIYQRIVAHQKEVVIYNGFFHSLFNEVGRRRVLADMLAWLARNCELPSS
jgi:esterase/lipase